MTFQEALTKAINEWVAAGKPGGIFEAVEIYEAIKYTYPEVSDEEANIIYTEIIKGF